MERLHILLIDDDEVDRMAICRMLDRTMLEVAVTEACDMWSGLAALEERRYDCVLVDQRLPDGDGLSLINRVKTAASHRPPMILLTMLDDEAIGIRALQEGAQDYLFKGCADSQKLGRAIRYAVERARLEDKLRQSQKMEAIGQLSGAVAHDFNNLLTVISGCADFLISECEETDIRGWLEEISGAAALASTLTKQLLAFGRRQHLDPQVIELQTVVGDVVTMIKRLIGKDVELIDDTPGRSARVNVDPSQMKQVILNLAINAKDAMPNGGRLRIVTEREEVCESSGRTPHPLPTGHYVVLSVSDTGTGMSEETTARIFEPFYTTKPEGKGTGLGLATVHGIVQQSGGHIRVESEEGAGTTFRIYLPEANAEPTIEPRPTQTSAHKKPLHSHPSPVSLRVAHS